MVPVWIQEVVNSCQHDSEATTLQQKLSIVSPHDNGFSLSEGVIRYRNRIWVGQNSAL
jgi:hypothetical protein